MGLPALVGKPIDERATKADLDLAIACQLIDDGKLEQALNIANGVLDDDPDHPIALLVAGRICVLMQRHGMAYSLLKRSIAINDRKDTRSSLSAACIGMQRLDEARELLRESRRRWPNDDRALAQLCLLAVYDCNPGLAIELGNKVIESNPDSWDVHESLGYAHLMMGNWIKGWEGYERFIGKSRYRPLKAPSESCPYWDGSDGLDLYVRGEQGIGDEISFASILPEVIKTQNSVTFDCDEKLGGLFKRSFPGIEIHATRKQKNAEKPWLVGRDFDAHCLIGTLAYHKRKKIEDFPGTPYLIADPERRVQWRALLDTLPGKKVGIAWTGGSKNTFKGRRSLTLEALLPILKVPGISWVSLQYQDPTDDISEFEAEHGIKIHHWPRGAESQDYDDVAALVSELDVVITVCTAIVHLCGALGKECFVLAPEKPRWFYLLEGRKIPWYSSVEIFRQKNGAWPLNEVANRL